MALQVVKDETDQRGHPPGLVTIDSEDRRDHIMDRMVGIQGPSLLSSFSPL